MKIPKKENIPKILKVKELRDKGHLTFREIARVMQRDVREVHRWYVYDLKKLSTYVVDR